MTYQTHSHIPKFLIHTHTHTNDFISIHNTKKTSLTKKYHLATLKMCNGFSRTPLNAPATASNLSHSPWLSGNNHRGHGVWAQESMTQVLEQPNVKNLKSASTQEGCISSQHCLSSQLHQQEIPLVFPQGYKTAAMRSLTSYTFTNRNVILSFIFKPQARSVQSCYVNGECVYYMVLFCDTVRHTVC